MAELKLHDDLVAMVKQVINPKKSYQDMHNPAKKVVLRRKLEFLEAGLLEQVNQLYGITAADIRTALSDQIFITDFEE